MAPTQLGDIQHIYLKDAIRDDLEELRKELEAAPREDTTTTDLKTALDAL